MTKRSIAKKATKQKAKRGKRTKQTRKPDGPAGVSAPSGQHAKRSVAVVMQDDDGRLLLQFRDETHPTLPFIWTFFGGGMDEGESPIEAAVRELKEELGLKVRKSDLKHLATLTGPRPSNRNEMRELHFVRLTRKVKWPKVVLEGAGCAFFRRTAIPHLPQQCMGPSIRLALDNEVI